MKSVLPPTIKQRTSEFFRRVGLPEPMKPEVFWRRLEKKHGAAGLAFSHAVDDRELGISDGDPYELKNKSEALSLEITGQYESKLYRDFTEWLFNANLGLPTSVLDVGCGNGVLTCLLACLFPEAKVVGFDPNQSGIEIAKSIAARQNISNVEFLWGTIDQSAADLSGRSFDLIVAVKAFHEILELPDAKSLVGHSINTVGDVSSDCSNATTLATIRRLLAEDGIVVCVDRWSFPASFAWWIRTVEAGGLCVSLHQSSMLRTAEAGGAETFPISVLSKVGIQPKPTNEQLLAFFVYDDMNALLMKIVPIEGGLAEAVYVTLGEKLPIASFEASYRDGSGVRRTQLFIAGSLSALYSTWSSGARHLYMAPAVAIGQMLQHFYSEAEKQEAHCAMVHGDHDCENILGQYGIQIAPALDP